MIAWAGAPCRRDLRQVIDLGGQWVGPKQTLLLEQAQAGGADLPPIHPGGPFTLPGRQGHVLSIPRFRNCPCGHCWSWAWCGAAGARIWRGFRKPATCWRTRQRSGTPIRWKAGCASMCARRVPGFCPGGGARLRCAEARQVSYLCFLGYLCARAAGMIGHGVRGALQGKFVGGAGRFPSVWPSSWVIASVLNAPALAVDQDSSGVTMITPWRRRASVPAM